MADSVRSWRLAEPSITTEHHHHVAGTYDDTALRADLVAVESRVSEAVAKLNQVIALVKQHESDIAALMDICRKLDGRISSVSLREAA